MGVAVKDSGRGVQHAIAAARSDARIGRAELIELRSPLQRPAQPARTPELLARLCALGARAALVAVMVQTTVYLVDVLALAREPHLLDADGDFSIFAWASACAVFGGALACVLTAFFGTNRRRVHLAGAAILAFLSLDETISIHERLTNDLPGLLGVPVYLSRVLWPAVYLPLLALLVVLLVTVARRLPRSPALLVHVGLALLGCAIAAELASTVLVAAGHTGSDPAYVVEVAVEEGCELGGWMLIGTALLAGAAAQLIALGKREAS